MNWAYPEEINLDKKRTIAIIIAAILGLAALLYLGGIAGQLMSNYDIWMNAGGMTGQATMGTVD